MTTKKIVLILGAVVVTVGLLIAIVAGGIVAFAFYSMGNSEAATVAKDFLRNNERLKQDIGEVKDFGSIVTGSINIHNGNGAASLNLKVEGERKTINATVDMISQSGSQWRVSEASYRNDAGQSIDLLSAYDAKLLPTGNYLK